MKLTPAANKEVHEQMIENFKHAAKVFPFQSITNFKPTPRIFRLVIGTLEVVSGVILLLIPGIARNSLLVMQIQMHDIILFFYYDAVSFLL